MRKVQEGKVLEENSLRGEKYWRGKVFEGKSIRGEVLEGKSI
jgi:hypothetical protein